MASNDHTPTDKLDKYRAKRANTRTPEPFGSSEEGPPQIFVVQKHAARRLHYDLRLEHNGVLLSWAVPAGPSLDTTVKRLAIRTEDHPIEYATFEGVIPAGEYGGGEMIVWDRGIYTPVEDIAAGLDKGKLWFDLTGYKLRGAWVLVRTKRNPKEWLLIKKPDGRERSGDDDIFREESVYTGRLVEDLASTRDSTDPLVERLRRTGATNQILRSADVKVMLARVAEAPFSREGWIFEIKYDGYRIIAEKRGNNMELRYRSGIDATDVFPEIVVAMEALPYDNVLLDGEVVALSSDGKPSFSQLQTRGRLSNRFEIAHAAVTNPVTFFGFDLLGLEDLDCRGLPLSARKEALEEVLPSLGPLRYVDHIATIGSEMFDQVAAMGLEGIMAKKAASPYRGGRSDAWLKMRVERTGIFAIVGFIVRSDDGRDLGAIQVAAMSESGLRYVGRVGSGFSERERRSLLRTLSDITCDDPPIESVPQDAPGGFRVRSEIVCEVGYKEYTSGGHLRQPVFVGVLTNGTIDAVDRVDSPEQAVAPANGAPTATMATDVVPTNLNKIFWESEGFTKGDLITYYRKIADMLLPYLEDRPIVLDRYPDGIAGKSFFQKNAPDHTPEWIRTEWIGETDTKGNRYFVCDDVESLLYIINSATIPIHLWASTVSHPDSPDWCILDLDPKDAAFSDVVVVARAIHDLCEQMYLPTYVKTSGKSGLHVLIPMGRRYTYDQQKLLGELIARVIEARHRDIATTIRSPARRGGKVYIDYLQNGKGKLLVSPYSVRPVLGATVSTPLRWSEVTTKLDVSRFTITSMIRRVAAMKEDPVVDVLVDVPDVGAGLDRLIGILADDT